jgi:meso-butanediol dehydrogenase / (S,S)-butanediol dehydrogenase / diacetyl reductase
MRAASLSAYQSIIGIVVGRSGQQSIFNAEDGMAGALNGKVIAITGAGGGIGGELARAAAQEGASVVAIDVDPEAAAAVVSQIVAAGGAAIAASADVRRAEEVAAALDSGVDRFGRLDVVVNNAGISRKATLLDTTEELYRLIFDVNVYGVLVGMQEAARIFRRQAGGGKIINTCSTASRQGRDAFAAYCASKAAVLSLVQSGARGLAADGITVNGIAPGTVETPLWDAVADDGTSRADRLDGYVSRIPLGRVATPADIVPAALFLASAGSDYMTGQVIMVDGGMVMV